MTDTSTNTVLQHALALAAHGFRLIPIPPGEKYPKGFTEWQKRATSDVELLTEWFEAHPDHGIGWAMGTQDDGRRLMAVDVDDWDAFADWGHGDTVPFLETVQSRTGRNGAHYVFELIGEMPPVSNGKLVEGVDIRGEGGFIVIPPTIHPNGNAYRWDNYPTGDNFQLCPVSVLETLARPVPQPSPTPTVSKGYDGDNPADWVRENIGIADMLVANNWTYLENKGDDQYWVRPGKNPRDGHSAVLHGDGPLVVFSTAAPGEFARVGRDNRDGSISLSPFEVYAAINCNGDLRAAGREVRKIMDRMPDTRPPMASATIEDLVSEKAAEPHAAGAASHNLPDEFWTSRPWLDHIRTAAQAAMASPDAVLAAVMMRYATAIPTTFKIPAVIGTAATFDMLAVIVGPSGQGKSVAMGVARELFEGPQYDSIVWDYPAPTGEGLVDAFFEMVTEEEGNKKVQVNKKTKAAVHFSVDEAMSVVSAGTRQSSTISSVLCAAWTGQNPGQGNASRDRKRVGMNPFTYRMAGVMGIQTSLGHRLLDEQYAQQGLSARLLFFTALDTNAPELDDIPDRPGPLDVPIWPTSPTTLVYDTTIQREIRETRRPALTGEVVLDKFETHLMLTKMKIAGILALMDDRKNVTPSDWALAQSVLDSSRSIREDMQRHESQQKTAKIQAAGHADAVRETAKTDVLENQKIARLRDSIIRKVDENGIARGALRKATTSKETRHRFDQALERAFDDGAVVERDGKLFQG